MRQKKKKNGGWGVAIVRLANVRFWGVANVLNRGWQLSQNGGWQMNAWQMSYSVRKKPKIDVFLQYLIALVVILM